MFEQFFCKMAPRMAASVCWCAMFCVVLFVKMVFCDDALSSYTREELMNIRATVPKDLCPIFINTYVNFLDILVKCALTFAYAVKRRRRGKRLCHSYWSVCTFHRKQMCVRLLNRYCAWSADTRTLLLLSSVTLTREISQVNSPNTDNLFNVPPERKTL